MWKNHSNVFLKINAIQKIGRDVHVFPLRSRISNDSRNLQEFQRVKWQSCKPKVYTCNLKSLSCRSSIADMITGLVWEAFAKHCNSVTFTNAKLYCGKRNLLFTFSEVALTCLGPRESRMVYLYCGWISNGFRIKLMM